MGLGANARAAFDDSQSGTTKRSRLTKIILHITAVTTRSPINKLNSGAHKNVSSDKSYFVCMFRKFRSECCGFAKTIAVYRIEPELIPN